MDQLLAESIVQLREVSARIRVAAALEQDGYIRGMVSAAVYPIEDAINELAIVRKQITEDYDPCENKG
jgi:hypothetical protein